MGMSASQARFLCLTARKNNVEFEGQQINQQRTTLANESASYYSELCNMSVPIPPSIDDYTKVYYTFNDGAMTNTITSLLYSKSEDKYHLNYLQEWQDDYGVVPASSSLVMNTGSEYTIGDDTLRLMDANAPTSAPTSFPDNEYYNSLKSSTEKLEALKMEAYYVALLREEFGNNEDYYVRYVKNTSTGAYEPYFYAKSQVEQPGVYNDRNLASVPAYTIGSVTKTKEVLNKECDVEVDSSGRYVAITFGAVTGTRTIMGNNQDEIDAYIATVHEPQISEYQTEIDVQKERQVLKEREIENSQDAGELVNIFMNASAPCFSVAVSGSYGGGCYKHVLGHLLELEVTGTSPSSTRSFNTSANGTITITPSDLSSNISSAGNSPLLVPVSDYISFGILNGVQKLNDEGQPQLPVVADMDWYQKEGIDKGTLTLSPEIIDLLSDAHIKSGNATEDEILISNYYMVNGEIKPKTIKQKAIDLYYLCSKYQSDPTEYEDLVKPLIYTFQFDMSHITKQTEQYWDTELYWTTEIVEDTDAYNLDHEKWVAGIPAYKTMPVEVPYTEPEKVYSLVVNTITDEEAYNQAMNDYNYQISQYDHKIQEINSKLEIIQQQDKQLELKIKQLDTEENAINTEMDAVKKVISKNVDSSYKTFSA